MGRISKGAPQVWKLATKSNKQKTDYKEDGTSYTRSNQPEKGSVSLAR